MLSPTAAKALDERHVDLGPRVVAVRLRVKETGARCKSGAQPLGLLFISGYAPMSTAPEEEWDAYLASMAAAIGRARPGDVVVIATDANSSVGRGSLDGSSSDERAGAVGPFGLKHINASGRRLSAPSWTCMASLRSHPSSGDGTTVHGSIHDRS